MGKQLRNLWENELFSDSTIYCLPLGKIMRQISPLTAGSHQEPDGVEYPPPVNLFRSLFLLRNHFFDDLPSLVGQVCVIMGFHFHVTPFVFKV